VISDLAKDSATVKNIGNGAAGTFMLTVNTTEGPSQFVIEDLPAGSSATVSFSCQAGPVTAVADSANQVTESNETNNTKTIAVVSC
jgi:subtilase family serine protease